jgi:type I restriction enzyme M protein
LGIVLPEGVLNNTNLQNVREYFEGRAKILLIVSIPQEVFMAAGATVKPSLMFFKRFTKEEQEQYDAIKDEAYTEVGNKYAYELHIIEEDLAKKGKDAKTTAEKKELRARKKEIENAVETGARSLIKQRFDYVIPIADVKQAGINSIGIKIKNDLIPLLEEFTKYRNENNLWYKQYTKTSYQYNNDGCMTRTRESDGIACEPEIFY